MPRVGVAVVLVFLAGLGATARASAQDERWLVWIGDPDDATTFEIEGDASAVRIVGREPGIVVGVDGERVRIVRSEWTAIADACPEMGRAGGEEIRSLQLDAVRDAGVTTLEPTFDGGPLGGMESFEDELEVLATIGRYVVVHRRFAWLSGCGAHPYVDDVVRWIDLGNGEPREVAADDPLPEADSARVVRRMCRLVADFYGDELPDFCAARPRPPDSIAAYLDPERLGLAVAPASPEGLDPDALVPTWTPEGWRGTERFAHREGECCPPWFVMAPSTSALPELLVEDETPPPVVARFLRRFPHATRLGFSPAP